MVNLICPHAESTPNCAIYNNWKKHYGKSQEAIIIENSGHYKCIALEILLDGFVIPEKDPLRDRVDMADYKDLKCSHLELLNNSKK